MDPIKVGEWSSYDSPGINARKASKNKVGKDALPGLFR
jgi:hypothetical protein